MITRLHKLPEGFIITSDDEIEEDDLVLEKYGDGSMKLSICTAMSKHISEEYSKGFQNKIIAQQDQIDFSALSEEEQKEIGWFIDAELLGGVEVLRQKYNYDDPTDNVRADALYKGFKAGFQKCQELLSDRRFTLEDMKKAMHKAVIENWQNYSLLRTKEWINDYLQSLSQSKSWEVEIETFISSYTTNGRGESPKVISEIVPLFTNGKIKILKLL